MTDERDDFAGTRRHSERVSSKLGAAALVTIALVALVIVMTWPLAARLTSSVAGDYGDPLLVMWAMGWVSQAVTAALSQPSLLQNFWDANIFFPETKTLAFSEHFIGQSVLVLPLYWLTGNLILCYNVMFLATFVLTGLGTFLLGRALTTSVWAGAIAAIVVAFNQYRLQYEVAHLHVLSIHWLPFVLFGLHRFLVTDSRWTLALSAVALVALNLSSVYYMAYCAPFILAFVLVELFRLGRWREPRVWLELWAAAAAVAVVMLPFVLPYLEVQQRLGVNRGLQELVTYSATLDHYRVALPGLFVPIALAVVGVALGRRPRDYVLAIALAVFVTLSMWLSLGPVVQAGGRALDFPALYPVLHENVPGYRGLRVPARFAMLFFFFLALLAGLGAARLARWRPRLAGVVLTLLLAVYLWQVRPQTFPIDQPLSSPDLAPSPAYLIPSPVLPSIYREVAALGADAVLVELPFGDPWYELRYMFFAATHGRRVVNGYSGVFPPSYIARQRVLARPLLDPAAAAQALAGATHVVVHRSAWRDDAGTRIARWLEALGAQLVAGSGEALLYQIQTTERLADLRTKEKDRWFTAALSMDGLSPGRANGQTVSRCPYASTLMTTRRFCARPSRVRFGAAGLSSP